MNLLKSLFIFLAPVWLVYVTVIGLQGILNGTNLVYASGILLSALPLVLFLSYILLFRSLARTSTHLLVVSVPSFFGYVVVLFIFLKNSDFTMVEGMALALSSFFITFLYIYWYSNNNRKLSSALAVDAILPEFSLNDYTGHSLSSLSFHGNKSILFFYRGNWCPLCMAQIDEVAKQYKKFADKNVDLIFIAPQSEDNTNKLAKKFKLDFKFYIDKNNTAAKQLGILHKFGLPMGFQALGYSSDSVYPTIIAIDETAKIIYSSQTSNYRIRPEPNELLEIFL